MTGKKTKFNYGIVVMLLLCFGIWLPNYAQYQVAAFGPSIMETMNLTTSQFSSIATAPLIPGIFLSLISGLLVDKFGARKILTGSVVITCVAAILRVFSTSYFPLYLSMIFLGVCATFLNSSTPKLMGQWFDGGQMSMATGFFLAFSNAGIALGTGTASLYSGMNGAFLGSAIIAGIVLVGWLVFMRDKPAEVGKDGLVEKVLLLEGLKVVAKSKVVWLTAVTLFLSAGSMTSLSNFLPSALAARGISENSARVVTMALTLGALVGCFVSPALFAKAKNPKRLFLVYGVIGTIGTVFAWRMSTNPVVLFILLLITGFGCNGFGPVIMTLPVRTPAIGTKYGGTAGGFVAMVQLGGSVLVPTYLIAPIAGSNYGLMFALFGCMLIGFMIVSQFLPMKGGE